MKKIRVGVIGLGFIGKQHVEALRRLPYIEIVAGSDSNLSMREWCEKNGIQKYYSDYKEMRLIVIQDSIPAILDKCKS